MALAYLGLAQGVPLVVFQLLGGVLADRTNRLRLLIVTQCLTAAVLAAAFLLAVLGWVRVDLYTLCWNLLPLGGLLSGVLAAALDVRFAILFGGAVVAINALLLLTSPRLRALR